jgi:hypothetical protein
MSALNTSLTLANLYDLSDFLASSPQRYEKLATEVVAALRRVSPDEFIRRSRETSTHYIWIVAENEANDAKLCIHQFKSNVGLATSHANTIHNHRYNFLTHVLRGGYVEETYGIDLELQAGSNSLHVPEPSKRPQEQGTTRVVTAQTYHRLADVAPGTITLVLKASPMTHTSTSINIENGRIQTHPSARECMQLLLNDLSARE